MMSKWLVRSMLAAACSAVLCWGCGARAAESAAAPAADGNAYAALANLPDWSGAWEPMFMRRPPGAAPPAPPKLTPEYAAQYARYLETNRKSPGLNFVSDVANCVPPGLPISMQWPYPIEFLFTPGRVTILIESEHLVRRIYTDGRALPKEPDATYQGTSVGHWEGDTLVVETEAILPSTSPLEGIEGHSADLRITERLRLLQPDLLEIKTTRADPAVFLEPYTSTFYYQRHRDWQIMEYVCEQNNHDAVDAQGKPEFNLGSQPQH